MSGYSVLKATVDEQGARYVGCPLCGGALPVKETKQGRPYLNCSECGMRMFVNFQAGRERFATLFPDGEED